MPHNIEHFLFCMKNNNHVSCRANNPSDLELLKQLNTELEAENVGLGVLRRRNAEVEEILAKLILNSSSNFAKLKTKTRSLGGNLRAESRNWRRVERILMLRTPNSSLGLVSLTLDSRK